MLSVSKIISYIFHPVLFSTVGSLVYFIIVPNHIPKKQEYIILAIIFVSTYILPLLLLYTLKHFGLIESLEIFSIQERKFPVIFLIILTFMLGKMLTALGGVDLLGVSFYGTCIGLLLIYLLFSVNIKASIHTMGMGTLIGFTMIMSLYYEMNLIWLIAIFVILFGFLGSARLALKAHKPFEVYIGVLIGIFSQLAVFSIL
ncbi:hypothetical protein [Namhaeicola litoreus]|uniref:PAP2 superfamily protein n=1 Tax=Namhaeicola litoreus TaxID=1052145 RepID=A0ABW3XYU5_9FLAO